MAKELKQREGWKLYLEYQTALEKYHKNNLRIGFLESCKHSDLIPKFFKFRVPNNGCFEEKTIREFQHKLLKKEINKAKKDLAATIYQLECKRNAIKSAAPRTLLPTILLYTRINTNVVQRNQIQIHNKKLAALAEEQERPLFSIKNTVIQYELDDTLPEYIANTLSLGPKNAVLDNFNPRAVLAEVDKLLRYCEGKNVDTDIMTKR